MAWTNTKFHTFMINEGFGHTALVGEAGTSHVYGRCAVVPYSVQTALQFSGIAMPGMKMSSYPRDGQIAFMVENDLVDVDAKVLECIEGAADPVLVALQEWLRTE